MKKISLILILSLFIYSCDKEEDFSEIPAIKFKNFEFEIENFGGFINQLGVLSFEFIDGDGNIGFFENSDTASRIEIPDVFIYEYTKVNGNFIISDTTNFLLPYFNEGIYRKYLKGDMEILIYLSLSQANDTIMYDFQIMDRDYNYSNLESTPELIIPEF